MHTFDGRIEIFGYPKDEFAPTDFHTATLVGQHIYVIGSLGYQGARRFNETPVYRLHIESMHMERMTIVGTSPGWIYRHRAELINSAAIRFTGGFVVREDGESPNIAEFVLDLEAMRWR